MPQAAEMSCRELVEVVTAYLDDAMPAPERRRFERHLAGCPGCRAYLAQMRTTIRVLGRIPAESISRESRDELVGAFRDWQRR